MIIIAIKDVPICRLFRVWQTGKVYRLLAKGVDTILCKIADEPDSQGTFWLNHNFEQLVELV